jgi:hypothetical protein
VSEQDESQIIVAALKRRTEITREAAAVRLTLQAGIAEMEKAVDVARSFMQRGSIVSFRNVSGSVTAQSLADGMKRIVDLDAERFELDRQLRALGVDLVP